MSVFSIHTARDLPSFTITDNITYLFKLLLHTNPELRATLRERSLPALLLHVMEENPGTEIQLKCCEVFLMLKEDDSVVPMDADYLFKPCIQLLSTELQVDAVCRALAVVSPLVEHSLAFMSSLLYSSTLLRISSLIAQETLSRDHLLVLSEFIRVIAESPDSDLFLHSSGIVSEVMKYMKDAMKSYDVHLVEPLLRCSLCLVTHCPVTAEQLPSVCDVAANSIRFFFSDERVIREALLILRQQSSVPASVSSLLNSILERYTSSQEIMTIAKEVKELVERKEDCVARFLREGYASEEAVEEFMRCVVGVSCEVESEDVNEVSELSDTNSEMESEKESDTNNEEKEIKQENTTNTSLPILLQWLSSIPAASSHNPLLCSTIDRYITGKSLPTQSPLAQKRFLSSEQLTTLVKHFWLLLYRNVFHKAYLEHAIAVYHKWTEDPFLQPVLQEMVPFQSRAVLTMLLYTVQFYQPSQQCLFVLHEVLESDALCSAVADADVVPILISLLSTLPSEEKVFFVLNALFSLAQYRAGRCR